MSQANPLRINFMFKVAACRRSLFCGWAAVLLALWLLSLGTALGQTKLTRTDYLDAKLGDEIAVLGRFHEKISDSQFNTVGNRVLRGPAGSEVVVPTEVIIDGLTGIFSGLRLQPANNAQNASGSGLNINNDGSCIVGYQDSGFFTPFHAFRWTAATKAVDLGTLDPPNNASRSSFATDTNQDCSVVVGFSDVTAQGAI